VVSEQKWRFTMGMACQTSPEKKPVFLQQVRGFQPRAQGNFPRLDPEVGKVQREKKLGDPHLFPNDQD
jgi:hypothetical protein